MSDESTRPPQTDADSPDILPEAEPTERLAALLGVFLALLLVMAALVILYVQRGQRGLSAAVGPSPTAIVSPGAVGGTPAASKGAATPAPGAVLATQVATATPTGPRATASPAATSTAAATTAPQASATRATAVSPAATKPGTLPPPTSAPAPAQPTGPRTWYFAEGGSGAPFRTYYALYNPGAAAAKVQLTLYQESGQPVQRQVEAPAHSQVRILGNDLLPNTAFGARIASDQPIFAQRTTLGDRDGTTAPGQSPAKTWYFAEGRTMDEFTTWLLVLNPGTVQANLKLTYLPVEKQPVARSYTVKAESRLTIAVQKDVPDGVLGIILESDQPVVAEESIFFDEQKAAYGGPGASALGKRWYATGNTEEGFTTQIAVLNPDDTGIAVKASVVGRDGAKAEMSYPVGPKAKLDIVVNDLLEGQLVAVTLAADEPFAAQTTTFYASQQSAAYSANPAPAAAKDWYLPETLTGNLYNSYVVVFNPGTVASTVRAVYVVENGPAVIKSYNLPGGARLNLWANDEVKDSMVAAVEIHASQPVTAERITIFKTTLGATSSAGMVGQ